MRHLLTVGVGHPYNQAARRLSQQAQATGWFDVIHIVDGNENTIDAGGVLTALEPLIRQYPKGAGLWAWKPALLRLAMDAAPEHAHVYYIDAGCELSPLASDRFEQLDAELEANSALLFHLPFQEDEWTKSALLEKFPSACGSAQIQATWLGFRKDATGKALLARWDECCREQNFAWLKDPVSDTIPQKQQHRHDQSVLSCIVKAEFPQLNINPWEDFFAPWMYYKNSKVLLAPVHALRSRDDRSILNPLLRASSLDSCIRDSTEYPGLAQRMRQVWQRLRSRLRDELIILRDHQKKAYQILRRRRIYSRASRR